MTQEERTKVKELVKIAKEKNALRKEEVFFGVRNKKIELVVDEQD